MRRVPRGGHVAMQPIEIGVEGIFGVENSVCIYVVGYIDGTNKVRCAELVQRAVSACPRSVLVDLAGLGHNGDSGLSIFMELNRTVGRYGGRVVYCGVPDGVLRTWEMLGIAKMIELKLSCSDAIAYLKSGQPES